MAKNLNPDVRLVPVEGSALRDGVFADHFSGMGYWPDSLPYGDPVSFLAYLPDRYGAGWDGKAWFAALDQVKTTMPVIPLSLGKSNYLLKPYVRGWTRNPSFDVLFRYVRIDHNWKNGETK